MPDERKVAELRRYIRGVYRYRPGLTMVPAEAVEMDRLWQGAGLTREQFGAIQYEIAADSDAKLIAAGNN